MENICQNNYYLSIFVIIVLKKISLFYFYPLHSETSESILFIYFISLE